MSYDPNPPWTGNIDVSELEREAICPSCGQSMSYSLDRILKETVFEVQYYHPRYIPDKVLVYCDDEDCDFYEAPFQLILSVKISGELKHEW